MAKVGRPSKYRPEYCEALVEHMATGASMASFAADIDVARSTLNEWAEHHEDFSEALKRGKAKCSAWWEARARDGAVGADCNASLIIFGLKNMAADDWRDKREVDNTSSDGSMTPRAFDPGKMSTAWLQELLEKANNSDDNSD